MDEKVTIQFSHANGFPGSCYQQLFNLLPPNYEINYIDTIGFHPEYPVTDNWPYLVEELIETTKSHDKPVIGVGHSLGGILTYLAAAKAPEIYTAVILLEAPILPAWKAWVMRRLKRIDQFHWFMPGGKKTLRRRNQWATEEDVVDYLQERPLFKEFTLDCLRDYARHGTVRSEENFLTLKIPPEIEYKIFSTFPDTVGYLVSPLDVPCWEIAGKKSHFITRADRLVMQSKFKIEFEFIRGGHLFPFENPIETAKMLNSVITSLRQEKAEWKKFG